jgi:hypothetical protein
MMISDDSVAQFQRDGAVCIRQLFRPDELEEPRPGRAPRSRAARMIPAVSSRTFATGVRILIIGVLFLIRRSPQQRAA